MLPPIDHSVLQNNPKFATLHANLTNNFLNPNGSTKNHPAQKERDAVTDALQTARLQSAKSQLIKSSLTNLDLSPQSTSQSTTSKLKPPTNSTKPQPVPLPTELIELIILLSDYITSPIPTSSTQTLLSSTPQWTSLPTHLPRISALLSSHLHTLALALTRIHSPTTNASYLHRSIPKLVPAIQGTLLEHSAHKTELSRRRTEIVGKTTVLLGLYHLATTLCILHLEQSTHGLLSRHLKSKIEFLSLSAQTLSLSAKEKASRGEKLVYSDEVKSALWEYMRGLKDARERARDRRKHAEKILWGYGVGRQDGGEKEKLMKEIARVYGEMMSEVKDVKKDVDKLRGK